MNPKRKVLAGWVIVLALLGAWASAHPAEAAKRKHKKGKKNEDVEHKATRHVGRAEVALWLLERYPQSKWQQGPTRLESRELAATYPNRQFWAVYSSPPLPGATPPPSQNLLNSKSELPARPVSALVEVDVAGKIGPAHPEMGRLQATDKPQAARVGAAVLSLTMGKWAPPGVIQPSDVLVERVPGYWQFTVRSAAGWEAMARVSEQGQLATATRRYAGPMPH